MYCMKCGREVKEGQLFCDLCLADMAKYPVKPGIAIQLPSRKDSPASKRNPARRRQAPKPEEQIRTLKRRLTRMTVLWLITLSLLLAAIYPTVSFFLGKHLPQPGQNYTAITSTESK